MKITEGGQVTIPRRLREKYGIHAGTELEFLEAKDGLLIVKKIAVSAFEKHLGKANAEGLPRSTDEVLGLLRDGE